MEPTFPPSMLMFSHLPPVTTFARLGSELLPPPPPPPPPPLLQTPADMILKKEPGSPPVHTADFLQSLTGIKQEKLGEHEQYHQYYGERQTEIVEVTVGSPAILPDLGLSRELLIRPEKNGCDPKHESPSMKKTRRPSSEVQEAKSKRRRSDSSKSLSGDGEAASVSPTHKPHTCEHCKSAFRSSYHLRRHVLIHTGERPFQCSQCNMSFIQKYLLQRHEKIHSGEKPFTCDQCSMKFIQKYHMERHKRTHSGEKPYKCDTCQQYFSRTDRLLKHKRTCGENMNKGSLDPGSSNPGMDGLSGNFDLSQGNSNFSGRKKGKSRNGPSHKEHKQGNKLNEAHLGASLDIQTYAVDVPIVSSSSASASTGIEDLDAKGPKLVFKKVNRKQVEKNNLSLESQSANMGIHKLSDKSNSPLDMVGNTNVDTLNLLQSSTNKGSTSSNYDDAVQFLKKRRYLQASSSNNAYSVNVGHMVAQQSVIQSVVPNVMDGDNPLTLMDSQALNVEIKNCHDKSVIPDEVLQSILDHYTHKSVVHPDVSFNIAEHHVELQPAADHSELVQEDNVCSDSSTPNDKANMFQEYSKHLQQALERTSHTTSFPLATNFQFVSLSSSLANHSLFPDKQIYTTSPLECGFSQSVTSVLPSALPKSHFGMVVGPQTGFSLSLETQQLTPSQELADQIDSQKTLDTSSGYQISSQELNGQKDHQKGLESSSGFHLQLHDLASTLEQHKDVRHQVTCQIENFAQAFGSQFKVGNRVPISFNTSTDGGVDHRLRTSTPEFSGYTNLLSDVSEAGSTRVKTSTSQSFRYEFTFQKNKCKCPSKPKGVTVHNLKEYLAKDDLETAQARREKEYEHYKKREHTENILIALPNSPLGYPTHGVQVLPLDTINLPGLQVNADLPKYTVSLEASLGTMDFLVKISGTTKCQVHGKGEKHLTISTSNIRILNLILKSITYTSTVYDIDSLDIVKFTLNEHTAQIPISIRQPPMPRLHDPGKERKISDLVTITTKTFLRYDKLRILLKSIRQYYPDMKVIVADDNDTPEKIDDPNVEQYIMPFAKGWFAGRNLAVSQVTTKYFLWVDDDFVFTNETIIEKMVDVLEATDLDLVGGDVAGNHFSFTLIFEEGGKDGDCLHWKKGTYHTIPGFPHCSMSGGVVNFFLAHTDRILGVGFDPKLSRVAHTEFFIDALGRLRIGSCSDVTVGHQSKKIPKDKELLEKFNKYKSFRENTADQVRFKLGLLYFKNRLSCFIR
ncbi:zinc finger protein 281 [Leptodactylus fuscus]|uniref:zinc finger protein 281 n=1 Tax=Leptodactylus fuscus TaxID=238119 RepID=UPI003F4ED468